MAASPAYAATPVIGSGLVPATLDTSLTAPANVTTILTGGASGSIIDEITFQGVGTTAAGVVNVFLYDGTTYHLVDQVLLTAITSSTTAVAFRALRQYSNLRLKDTTWSLRVSQTIAGNQSMVKVTAQGANF